MVPPVAEEAVAAQPADMVLVQVEYLHQPVVLQNQVETG
jgi:hypothetical protein